MVGWWGVSIVRVRRRVCAEERKDGGGALKERKGRRFVDGVEIVYVHCVCVVFFAKPCPMIRRGRVRSPSSAVVSVVRIARIVADDDQNLGAASKSRAARQPFSSGQQSSTPDPGASRWASSNPSPGILFLLGGTLRVLRVLARVAHAGWGLGPESSPTLRLRPNNQQQYITTQGPTATATDLVSIVEVVKT